MKRARACFIIVKIEVFFSILPRQNQRASLCITGCNFIADLRSVLVVCAIIQFSSLLIAQPVPIRKTSAPVDLATTAVDDGVGGHWRMTTGTGSTSTRRRQPHWCRPRDGSDDNDDERRLEQGWRSTNVYDDIRRLTKSVRMTRKLMSKICRLSRVSKFCKTY